MKNYNVISHGKIHKIKETKTGHIIKLYPNKITANNICAGLNRGNGFGGETPRFFVINSKRA